MAQGITEESMPQQDSFLTQIKEEFQLGEQELNSYSPLVLAYIGDCVYELLIRTLLVGKANCQVSKLHKKAIDYVKAETQAAMIAALMDELTEEEQDVFRRGKNAKPHTIPKNASLSDYRRATGMEAVIGYLYLKDDMKRVIELVKLGLDRMEKGE